MCHSRIATWRTRTSFTSFQRVAPDVRNIVLYNQHYNGSKIPGLYRTRWIRWDESRQVSNLLYDFTRSTEYHSLSRTTPSGRYAVCSMHAHTTPSIELYECMHILRSGVQSPEYVYTSVYPSGLNLKLKTDLSLIKDTFFRTFARPALVELVLRATQNSIVTLVLCNHQEHNKRTRINIM
jgi:hypothetical protein